MEGRRSLALSEAGRDPESTVAVIESPSIKTMASGETRGYNAGKKIQGHKRPMTGDADAFPSTVHVHTCQYPGSGWRAGSHPGHAGRDTDGYEAVCRRRIARTLTHCGKETIKRMTNIESCSKIYDFTGTI